MARIAFTVMRVTVSPRGGRIATVMYPYGMMLKDIREVKEVTDIDMPGAKSVIVTRDKDPQRIYTAHSLTDLIGAINDTIDLTITDRIEREVTHG